jgi:hypothetical protein
MKMLKNYRTEYYRLYYQGREVAGQEGQKNHAEHFYKPWKRFCQNILERGRHLVSSFLNQAYLFSTSLSSSAR